MQTVPYLSDKLSVSFNHRNHRHDFRISSSVQFVNHTRTFDRL